MNHQSTMNHPRTFNEPITDHQSPMAAGRVHWSWRWGRRPSPGGAWWTPWTYAKQRSGGASPRPGAIN